MDRPLLPVYAIAIVVLVGCFGGGRDSDVGGFRERECNSGFSCANEAGRAKSAAEAERLYKRSCDLDYAGGCFALAYAYREGKMSVGYHDVPIPKDPERAFLAYDHACAVKDGGGCLGAAEMITKGEITTHGAVEPWLEKACDLGKSSRDNDTCARAGDARMAASEEDRAYELYKRGCEHSMGAAGSCLGFAQIEIKRGHPATAEKALGDACFFGKSGKACTAQGKLAAEKGNASEAARKFGDACGYGDAEACALAGDANKARDAQLRRESAERERQWEAERKKADAMPPAPASSGSAGASRVGASSGASSGGAPMAIHMKDASANGVHATTLDCTLQSGNLLASMVLLAGLADRTTALRACGIKKSFTAEWTMSSGTITAATAKGTGSPATDACAARALRQMKQSFTGTCTAELDLP